MKLTDEEKIFLAWLSKHERIKYFEMVIGKDTNWDSTSPLYGLPHVAFRIFLSPSSYLHCIFSNSNNTLYVTEYHCTSKNIPSMQVGFINRFLSRYRMTTKTYAGIFDNSKQVYIPYDKFMSILDKIDAKEFYSRDYKTFDSYHRSGGLY